MIRSPLGRRIVSGAVVGFCGLSVILALIPLGFILSFVVRQGLPALTLEFFTPMPKPVGEAGGGVANVVGGTRMVIGVAALWAVPIGIIAGIHLSEYKSSRLAS